MREILPSGSTRGEEVGLRPRFPSYSTSAGKRGPITLGVAA
jgi:hypothetical protein